MRSAVAWAANRGDVRPDAEFLAAAGARSVHFRAGMDPAFVASMATYLASEKCTTSQNMYSVLGGKYSRIFVGLTRGCVYPGDTAPSAEELASQMAQIDDMTRFDVPHSGLDEMDTVVAALGK